ncbi:MAG: hypothetical protein WCH65_03930 [bacterium]
MLIARIFATMDKDETRKFRVTCTDFKDRTSFNFLDPAVTQLKMVTLKNTLIFTTPDCEMELCDNIPFYNSELTPEEKDFVWKNLKESF